MKTERAEACYESQKKLYLYEAVSHISSCHKIMRTVSFYAQNFKLHEKLCLMLIKALQVLLKLANFEKRSRGYYAGSKNQ